MRLLKLNTDRGNGSSWSIRIGAVNHSSRDFMGLESIKKLLSFLYKWKEKRSKYRLNNNNAEATNGPYVRALDLCFDVLAYRDWNSTLFNRAFIMEEEPNVN